MRVVDICIGAVVLLLALRVVLRLLDANPAASFVAWLYGTTDQILLPFSGMFSPVISGGAVLEFSTLFAMLIYAFIGWLLIQLLRLLTDTVLGLELGT